MNTHHYCDGLKISEAKTIAFRRSCIMDICIFSHIIQVHQCSWGVFFLHRLHNVPVLIVGTNDQTVSVCSISVYDLTFSKRSTGSKSLASNIAMRVRRRHWRRILRCRFPTAERSYGNCRSAHLWTRVRRPVSRCRRCPNASNILSPRNGVCTMWQPED